MVRDKDRRARESSLAGGWTVEGAHTEAPLDADVNAELLDPGRDDQAETDRSELSNAALVLLGLLGGIYLLYTVVWFSWANAKSYENTLIADGSGSLGSVLQQVVFWIAPLAPVLWFFSVLVLLRHSKLGPKVIWLVVGIALLVPLPMFGGLF